METLIDKVGGSFLGAIQAGTLAVAPFGLGGLAILALIAYGTRQWPLVMSSGAGLGDGSCTPTLRIIRLDLSGAVCSHQPDGSDLSHRVPKAWCRPVALPIGTPGPLTLTISMLSCRLQRLGLWPRRHPKEQHLAQRPHVLGQSGRHGWGPRLPAFGCAVAVGRFGLRQRLA